MLYAYICKVTDVNVLFHCVPLCPYCRTVGVRLSILYREERNSDEIEGNTCISVTDVGASTCSSFQLTTYQQSVCV